MNDRKNSQSESKNAYQRLNKFARVAPLALTYEDMDSTPVIPATIPAFSWRGGLSPLIVAPIIFNAGVTLLAPLDVLDALPVLKIFTTWVQSIIPFVNMRAHADSTAFPQVALLSHSLAVILILLLPLIWTWQSIVNYSILLERRRGLGRAKISQHLFVNVLGPPFVFAMFYAFIAIPGDPSFGKGLTTHSRLGFSFMTVCILYPGAMILGGQLVSLRLFIDTYIRK